MGRYIFMQNPLIENLMKTKQPQNTSIFWV